MQVKLRITVPIIEGIEINNRLQQVSLDHPAHVVQAILVMLTQIQALTIEIAAATTYPIHTAHLRKKQTSNHAKTNKRLTCVMKTIKWIHVFEMEAYKVEFLHEVASIRLVYGVTMILYSLVGNRNLRVSPCHVTRDHYSCDGYLVKFRLKWLQSIEVAIMLTYGPDEHLNTFLHLPMIAFLYHHLNKRKEKNTKWISG